MGLLVVTTISALASLFLCWSVISSTRELRILQTQIAIANNTSARVNALASEALEYSKTNPAINPLLESIGAKPGKNAPAATKPAAR